jgi:hypothetical protein
MAAGNGEVPGGLCPPHAGKNTNKEMATRTHANQPKRKLPMHPLVAARFVSDGRAVQMEWKTFSVENEEGFSKQMASASRHFAAPHLQWDAKGRGVDASWKLGVSAPESPLRLRSGQALAPLMETRGVGMTPTEEFRNITLFVNMS